MLHANMTYFPVVFRKVRRLPFKHLFGKIETNLPSVFHRSCTSLVLLSCCWVWPSNRKVMSVCKNRSSHRLRWLMGYSDSWVEILTFQIWIQWYFFQESKIDQRCCWNVLLIIEHGVIYRSIMFCLMPGFMFFLVQYCEKNVFKATSQDRSWSTNKAKRS